MRPWPSGPAVSCADEKGPAHHRQAEGQQHRVILMDNKSTSIRHYPHVVEAATAARYIGAKVANLRKAAAALGPGARLTGQAGRSATFLGQHPDPDYLGREWWRIAEVAGEAH